MTAYCKANSRKEAFTKFTYRYQISKINFENIEEVDKNEIV